MEFNLPSIDTLNDNDKDAFLLELGLLVERFDRDYSDPDIHPDVEEGSYSSYIEQSGGSPF